MMEIDLARGQLIIPHLITEIFGGDQGIEGTRSQMSKYGCMDIETWIY